MAITTKSFTDLVRGQVTAIQGSAKSLVDLTIGSILRSIIEANASVTLWLQGLIIALLATTRASTSTSTDLDTWMADYGLTRLVAIAASGQVTFARFTNTSQALVPIGASVQTQDGSQKYTVVVDTTNTAYSATLGGYVIAVGVSSINIPVVASLAGIAGNAQALQINTLTTAISGVDTVSNAITFINGANSETDAALRLRFIAYLASLSKATKNAVGYAITSLQQGLNYTLTENFTYGGVAQMGYFYVVVDDGTGTPSSTILTNVANSIEAVRPVTSTFGVFSPVIVTANTVMVITTDIGYDNLTLVGLVGTAISKYINSLPLGASLTYSRLSQIAYEASVGVINVSSITLNSGTADITATPKQVIKSGTVTVS
jgi:uncharacterized phage protein gp47/JayE